MAEALLVPAVVVIDSGGITRDLLLRHLGDDRGPHGRTLGFPSLAHGGIVVVVVGGGGGVVGAAAAPFRLSSPVEQKSSGSSRGEYGCQWYPDRQSDGCA